MSEAFFDRALFRFPADLKLHNDRAWFAANKDRYERDVRGPMLRFIEAVAAPLHRISPEVIADARPVGGSMFPIHRDTRFARDKSPYKTNAGAHFRHRSRDAHAAPGYYLHLAPGQVFFGAGVWHPDPASLLAIRKALVERSADWKRITGARAFKAACELWGGERQARAAGLRGRPPAGRGLEAHGLHGGRDVVGSSGDAGGLPRALRRSAGRRRRSTRSWPARWATTGRPRCWPRSP